MNDEPRTKGQNIVEGTIAQALGGSLATVIVGLFASFNHFFPAMFESAFGTLLGILSYLIFKGLRK